jgi:hypothetical protein
MLLARFRRYVAGAAEPETGSENFCGADALSGFAYRARPPTVNPLDGSENFLIAAYTPIRMHGLSGLESFSWPRHINRTSRVTGNFISQAS